jgi:hypothetical protein
MRLSRPAFVLTAIGLAGCGYPGDPLPPALNRPNRVTDLAALQRGEKVYVSFTLPARTTEGLPVKELPDIELRLGTMPDWEENSTRIPAGSIKVQKVSVSAEVPVTGYFGKSVVVGVRIHGPQGRDVGWSNLETVVVVPTLAVPQGLVAKDAPDAVLLEWHAAAPEFRVFRKMPEEKDWTLLGSSPKASYLDGTIEFGKPYQYFVQSVEKTGIKYAESEISETFTFTATDRFAPATPVGLAAVPGTRSIELLWERNAEKDLASYRIYRDGMKVAEGEASPSFSDRDVKPGTKYRYQVSAVDTAGNESKRSDAAESAIP